MADQLRARETEAMRWAAQALRMSGADLPADSAARDGLERWAADLQRTVAGWPRDPMRGRPLQAVEGGAA